MDYETDNFEDNNVIVDDWSESIDEVYCSETTERYEPNELSPIGKFVETCFRCFDIF